MREKIKEKTNWKKMAKANKHFVKDNQTDKNINNICSISSDITDMQIKTTMSYHQKPTGAEKIKEIKIPSFTENE